MAENEKQTNRERLKDITDSIERGIQDLFQSDKYAQYLRTMSRFHKYSVNNTMLIYMQKPDATLVAGFNKWRDQFERNVMKGEKGIKIIAPTPFKKKIEQEKRDPDTNLPMLDADGKVIIEEKEIKIPMFKPVTVFDVSQTDGKPLPQLAADLQGNVQNYEVFMESLLLKAMRIAHAVQIEDLIARLNQLRNAGEFDAVKSLVPIYEMPVGQIVVPKDSTFAPRSNAAIETKVVSADSIPVIPEKKTLVTEPVAESKAEPEVVPSAPEPVSEPDEDDQPPFDPDPIAEDAPVTMESTPAETAEEIVTEPVREDVPLEVIMEEEVIELNDDAAPIPEDPESLASLTKPAAVQTPEQIWQELIIDVRDNLRKDFLAIAMNDGSPLSYRRNSLTVAFDPDYEAFQGTTTEKELQLLTSRLRAISGEPGANLFIEYRQGLATPLQISKKEDVEKLKEKAAADPLVQDTLDLFHGHLADAHSAGQPAEL